LDLAYLVDFEADKQELALMTQIVDKLTVDLDLSLFHDSYQERIEAMVQSKMKGELAQVERRNQRNQWPRA
jgi:non-homologous end joining protein Ku